VGDYLYLPVTGMRYFSGGFLASRGDLGYYWSSSASTSNGRSMSFNIDDQNVGITKRSFGHSVRCVAAE
jgi:hypothetical protein